MPETTATRPAAPALLHRAPDCSLCLKETYWLDGGFHCDDCGLSWPDQGYEPVGEWNNPDAAQCPSLLNDLRCYLDDDHPGDDHLNPEMLCGWKTRHETGRAVTEEEEEEDADD